MATYVLRKVSRLPQNVFFARWRLKDGTEVEHTLTEAEYRALALEGAGAPPNRTGDLQALWLHAREQWVFDTPDGLLHPGDMTDAWPGIMRFFLGFQKVSVPLAKLIGTVDAPTVALTDLPPGVTIENGVATVV